MAVSQGSCRFFNRVIVMHLSEIHIVPDLPRPVRLREYALGIFQAAPTNAAIKKALKKQFITVDGEIGHTGTFIKGGERIELNIPEVPVPTKKLVFPVQVLFEDEYLAIVHKPAGILVSGNRFVTMARALPQNLWPSTLPDATVPQPVHRLDYATTGILLAGKTSAAIRRLGEVFARKQIQKTYYAITIGTMLPEGKLSSEIDDKPACSTYTVCASVPSERFGCLNLVKVMPQTGRRHQVRKHMAQLGCPILGDATYGRDGLVLKGKGLYLHAGAVRFTHPFTGVKMFWQDPLPEKFGKIFPNIKEQL